MKNAGRIPDEAFTKISEGLATEDEYATSSRCIRNIRGWVLRARAKTRGGEPGKIESFIWNAGSLRSLEEGPPKTNTSTLVERRVQVGRQASQPMRIDSGSSRRILRVSLSLSLSLFLPWSVSLIVFNGIDKLYDKSLVSRRYRSASVVNSTSSRAGGGPFDSYRSAFPHYGGNTCEAAG